MVVMDMTILFWENYGRIGRFGLEKAAGCSELVRLLWEPGRQQCEGEVQMTGLACEVHRED